MNCVILQPSYIPWRGYFHQIQKADIFIFYDDVQYDRHGWRNRNRIKTPDGSMWLTIPVLSKDHQHIKIKDAMIVWRKDWNTSHYNTLRQFYKNAPFFGKYEPILQEFYTRRPERLADFTIDLTIALARELGIISTQFVRSSDLDIQGSKTERLVKIVQSVGATHYISGPSAKDYLEEDMFDAAGITLEYMTYDYPPYPQLYGAFEPQVSILDLLFMTGADAPRFVWGANEA